MLWRFLPFHGLRSCCIHPADLTTQVLPSSPRGSAGLTIPPHHFRWTKSFRKTQPGEFATRTKIRNGMQTSVLPFAFVCMPLYLTSSYLTNRRACCCCLSRPCKPPVSLHRPGKDGNEAERKWYWKRSCTKKTHSRNRDTGGNRDFCKVAPKSPAPLSISRPVAL